MRGNQTYGTEYLGQDESEIPDAKQTHPIEAESEHQRESFKGEFRRFDFGQGDRLSE